MAKRGKKKRAGRQKWMLVSLALLVVAGGFILYKYLSRPFFVHYSAFGIDLPVNYTVHGIDVSKHQSIISWKDVGEMDIDNIRLQFVFMKATEGIENFDPRFKNNWQQAGRQNITRGAYHFFIATKSGKAQALNFIRTVNLQPGDLPPVLDVEQTYGATTPDLQQRVLDWLIITERRYGVKPIIYTNVDFYSKFLAGKFEEYNLWVAHYLVKDKPRIKRNWVFWQHSELGHVNGINSFVDFNVFNGDSASFEQLKIK
jgi:lysozyme